MARIDKASFELGIALASMKYEYYFDGLVAFIRGENAATSGEMNFGRLKPLFDKYGYEITKEAILKISKKEVQTNE